MLGNDAVKIIAVATTAAINNDCYEAQEAYDAGAWAQRRYEQGRREQWQQEEHEEMMAYEHAMQKQAERDQYDAWCEEQYRLQEAEHYDNLFADHLIETIDLPRWENEGGPAWHMQRNDSQTT